MGVFQSYRLRTERKKWLVRAVRKRRELTPVSLRLDKIRPSDPLVFFTLRNECPRLPYFLTYYRALGFKHFLAVDNGSEDGSADYLVRQPDLSLWHSDASYKRARFGMDWMNWLLRRYGHGHWCLTVDPDEFFVYPFYDSRSISALTDWLDASALRSFGTMLLDMYPKQSFEAEPYEPGLNPLEIAEWFDSGNYTIRKNPPYDNLWIQGGPRARTYFADNPGAAPALNKIALVKWHRSYAYVSGTHMLLPRGLNRVYDEWGGEKASGVLLHTKFLSGFSAKAEEELHRRQHYGGSAEYRAYARSADSMWTRWSERYVNWRQLEIHGLMSKGNWT